MVELFAHGTVGRYVELRKGENNNNNGGSGGVGEKLRMLTVATVVRRHVEESLSRSDDIGGGSSGESNNNDVEVRMAAFKIKKCETDGVGRMSASKTRKKKKTTKRTSDILNIPYSLLASELHIPYHHDDDHVDIDIGGSSSYNETDHMRQLEDVLIQCVYSNIIAAKLDQSSRSMTIMPHVSLSSIDSLVGGVAGDGRSDGGADRGAFSSGGGGGRGRAAALGAAVLGSVLSRDLDATTPENAKVEAGRMLYSLRVFLDRSNSVWKNIDRSSRVIIKSDRWEDEMRWANVHGAIEGGPSSHRHHQREYALSFGGGGGDSGGRVVSGDIGRVISGGISGGGMDMGFGGEGTRLGGMIVNAGIGGAGGGGLMVEGGVWDGGDSMEVADGVGAGVGRRQVKRSKGGHSAMMGRG